MVPPYKTKVVEPIALPTAAQRRAAIDHAAYDLRWKIPGLRMTLAPAHLRFFQARFEPLAPVRSFAAVPSEAPAEVEAP